MYIWYNIALRVRVLLRFGGYHKCPKHWGNQTATSPPDPCEIWIKCLIKTIIGELSALHPSILTLWFKCHLNIHKQLSCAMKLKEKENIFAFSPQCRCGRTSWYIWFILNMRWENNSSLLHVLCKKRSLTQKKKKKSSVLPGLVTIATKGFKLNAKHESSFTAMWYFLYNASEYILNGKYGMKLDFIITFSY